VELYLNTSIRLHGFMLNLAQGIFYLYEMLKHHDVKVYGGSGD
jgi:hypothetical protein